ADGAAEALLRVAHHVPVLGVDPGRYVVRSAHRNDRGDVVDVAVGEDDGDGLEPVSADRFRDAVGGLVSRVDDHALLTGGGGDEVTVRPPGPGGEPGNEHDRPSSVSVRRLVTGLRARGQEPTGAANSSANPYTVRGTRRRSADRTHASRPAQGTHGERTR